MAAPTTMMKIAEVPSAVSTRALRKLSLFSERRNPAMAQALAAPIAPASVAVNAPQKMPPSTPTMSSGSGQTACPPPRLLRGAVERRPRRGEPGVEHAADGDAADEDQRRQDAGHDAGHEQARDRDIGHDAEDD